MTRTLGDVAAAHSEPFERPPPNRPATLGSLEASAPPRGPGVGRHAPAARPRRPALRLASPLKRSLQVADGVASQIIGYRMLQRPGRVTVGPRKEGPAGDATGAEHPRRRFHPGATRDAVATCCRLAPGMRGDVAFAGKGTRRSPWPTCCDPDRATIPAGAAATAISVREVPIAARAIARGEPAGRDSPAPPPGGARFVDAPDDRRQAHSTKTRFCPGTLDGHRGWCSGWSRRAPPR